MTAVLERLQAAVADRYRIEEEIGRGGMATVQDMPVVCFEAPHRVLRTLRDAVGYFGERPMIVARELTKVHEEWLQGDANALAARLPDPRGEFVLILGPVHRSSTKMVTDEEIAAVFGQLPDNGGGSRRDSIRRTARALGVSSKAVYTALERHKISGK